VWEALRTVGMEKFADTRIVRVLPGGQQQRVFLARALAQEAEVLLLTSPSPGWMLHPSTRSSTSCAGCKRRGKTVIVTTHDLSCVAERFDLALLLNRRVVAFGRPEEVFTSQLLNETYQSTSCSSRSGIARSAIEDGDPRSG
jgi:ABC-type Mn2+/Zn2+ transport system ATPase subunit